MSVAEIYYEFADEGVITFYISGGNDQNTVYSRSFDGEIVDTYKTEMAQLEIDIWKLKMK